ncbi:hypothetical protein [Gemmatimonas sp.]|uniref:hypothetical protein n=1 Tax=Gemmatimonas sp. TaxID=1962908 RepID=UPI003DA50D8B
MVTDTQVQAALRTAWCDAFVAPPAARLLLPHVMLVQQQWKRGMNAADASDAVRHLHGDAARYTQVEADVRRWRVGRDGPALLTLWEAVVIADEHEHWMPRLVGVRSSLPMTASYAQLATRPHGPEAMLLLLLAGEVGYRPIIMHWASAAERMRVPEAVLMAAATLLVEEGWVDREVYGDEPPPLARVLTLRTPRTADVLATLTAM